MRGGVNNELHTREEVQYARLLTLPNRQSRARGIFLRIKCIFVVVGEEIQGGGGRVHFRSPFAPVVAGKVELGYVCVGYTSGGGRCGPFWSLLNGEGHSRRVFLRIKFETEVLWVGELFGPNVAEF